MTLAGPRLFPSAEGWGWSFSRFKSLRLYLWACLKTDLSILTNDSYHDLYLLNMFQTFQPFNCWIIMDGCFLAARADGIHRIGWTVLAVAGSLCHSATKRCSFTSGTFPRISQVRPRGTGRWVTCCLRIAVASGFFQVPIWGFYQLRWLFEAWHFVQDTLW